MHDPAWNYLARGEKKWWFWAPGRSSYSKTPPTEGIKYWESDADLSCTQEQGDVVLVPEDWGHATYALGENVGIAAEYYHWKIGAHWTLRPPPALELLRLEPSSTRSSGEL